MRYKHISQKPYCCLPACVQMILYRRGVQGTPTQAEIAENLGVIVPPNDPRWWGSSRNGRWLGPGAHADLPEYSLTRFFEKYQYTLREEYRAGSYFHSEEFLGNFLIYHLGVGSDIIVGYQLHAEMRCGHVSLIEDIRGGVITLHDPSSWFKRQRRVDLSSLFCAMHNRDGHIGEVWVISESN